MRAAADVIHACACCGAVGIPENDQVLQVTVAEYRVFGQIYTQVLICMRYFCIHKLGSENSGKMVEKKKKTRLTLYIGSIPGVLPHSQASTICGCSPLREKVLYAFIIDLQIASAKAETQMQNLIRDCTHRHKLMKGFRVDMWMAQHQMRTKQVPIHCLLWKEMHSRFKARLLYVHCSA